MERKIGFIQHTVCIHLVDHVLQLGLRGVLSQRPHHCAQFFGGDGAVTVLVEQRERLLELCREGELSLESGHTANHFCKVRIKVDRFF